MSTPSKFSLSRPHVFFLPPVIFSIIPLCYRGRKYHFYTLKKDSNWLEKCLCSPIFYCSDLAPVQGSVSGSSRGPWGGGYHGITRKLRNSLFSTSADINTMKNCTRSLIVFSPVLSFLLSSHLLQRLLCNSVLNSNCKNHLCCGLWSMFLSDVVPRWNSQTIWGRLQWKCLESSAGIEGRKGLIMELATRGAVS